MGHVGCSCLLGRRAWLAGAGALACVGTARAAPSAGPADPVLTADLVAGNRILAKQGVLDAFGHISARHDRDPTRFLLSRNLAPGLVKPDDLMEFDLDGNAIDARGRPVFLERFIHAEVFRARPDVMSVVHSHSASVIPFSVSKTRLKPVYLMGAFLGGDVPVFDIRDVAGDGTNLLIANGELARALVGTLGQHTVVLMRGHGSVAVGTSVRQAVFRAVYTEVNAKLESDALRLGDVTAMTESEAAAATKTQEQLMPRAWDLWARSLD